MEGVVASAHQVAGAESVSGCCPIGQTVAHGDYLLVGENRFIKINFNIIQSHKTCNVTLS